MNILQNNTYRNDLNWLHFHNQPKAQEKQQVNLHIRFCSLSNNSKQQLGAPAQTWKQYSMYGCIVDL